MTFPLQIQQRIRRRADTYAQAIIANIDDRFPSTSRSALDAFSIFNVEEVPADTSSDIFKLHGEVKILADHFFQESPANEEFKLQWKNFKFELMQLRRKWLLLKSQLADNKLKPTITSTEWTLTQILTKFEDDSEFGHIVKLAHIAMVTPVSNA